MEKIGFIGAGTVGTALAFRMKQQGYLIASVFSRSRPSSQRFSSMIEGSKLCSSSQEAADMADLVFITTPDDAIGDAVARVKWRKGQGVAHCSGADSVLVLEPARQSGAETGTFHPLQTFASISYAIENIPGSTFAIEGSGALLNKLQQLATALGGNWIVIKAEDKVLYHASAVMACNYLVTMVKLSTDLWQNFGLDSKNAIKALTPLLKGTLNNLNNVGLPDALTGPIARGDTGTIQKHIKALGAKAPSVLSAYRVLGLQTVPIALAKGKIDGKKAEALKELLQGKAQV